MSGRYIYIYYPNHTHANQNGTVALHRLVAEYILGRPLLDSEVVHHIDENKNNNLPSNLMVFKTQADHAAYHQGYEAILDGDVYICPDRIQKGDDIHYAVSICPICGNIMGRASKICKHCQQDQSDKKLEDIVTKEELDNLIHTKSFTEIGRMYHVSDNAVRKWCVRYGLPSTKREIRCEKT